MNPKARVYGFGIGNKEGWKRLEDELGNVGAEIKGVFDKIGDKFKFVCVSPDLTESVEEMANAQREHVVMVRVDDDTKAKLDLWVDCMNQRLVPNPAHPDQPVTKVK